jgi:long-chain acyl-CoA synthetase
MTRGHNWVVGQRHRVVQPDALAIEPCQRLGHPERRRRKPQRAPRELLEGYFDFHFKHRADLLLVVTELSTLADLGLMDRMLAWRERLTKLVLGGRPTLDQSTRAVIAFGDCRIAVCSFPILDMTNSAAPPSTVPWRRWASEPLAYRLTVPESFTGKFAAGLASYGEKPCIDFEGRWYSGDDITGYAKAIAATLRDAGVVDGAPVGLVVRNRLQHAAAIIGFLAAGRPVSMIYSFQSPEAIGRDIEKLNLAAIVADRDDWTAPVIAAAKRAGSAGVAISLQEPTVAAVEGLEHRDSDRRHAEVEPGVALQILTSGTTGPPKRQDIKTPVLERTVFSVTSGEKAPPGAPPEFAYWQFGGIGVCQLVAGVYNARRIVMLERFTVAGFVNAIKTHRIKRSGVQPAVIRMLLDADVPKDDLASLEFLISASGPLDPETRDEFEKHFDIPIRLAYGATEFAGSLCAWTPADVEKFGETKRNSVGKPLPDTQVRIVDPDTGNEQPAGEQGLLEAKVAPISPDWIRTTDVASIDADGFVTLHGRADGAINRGGFKILPETVRRVLVSHSAVRDACVVGVPDKRLGQVPFAAIEATPGMTIPSSDELKELVRQALPVYNVPVDFAVVDELPRNPALKVSLPAVAALYERRANK